MITSLLRLDLESAVVSSLPMLLLLLKATCLLLAALGASLLLQRASAGVRHLVWLVAVAALLVLPALAAWSPLRLEVLPESFAAAGRATPPVVDVSQPVALPGTPEAARSVSQSNVVRQPAGGVDASRSPAAVDGMTSAPLTVRSVASMALTVWGSVAAILAAWLAFGALSVYRIVRRARPLSSPEWQTPLYEIADRFGLTDAPRLLRSDDVKMPFACGLFHPTIVLPAESDDWSADRRSAVLLHELGHVRRRDLVGHTLGRLACAIYWFHPLVWTAARKLRSESERACDDLALICGARPSEYAEHLLDIVSCVRNHSTPAVALAMAHRKEFEGRMLAILNPELRRKGPSRLQSLSLVGGLAALSLVVSAAAPSVRPPADVAPVDGPRPRVVIVTRDSSALADSPKPVSVRTDARKDTQTSRVTETVTSSKVTESDESNPASGIRVDARRMEVLRLATPSRQDSQAQQKSRDERPALLANILRTDSSAELRRIAAWGLRDYGDKDVAVDALIVALRRDTDATVRDMAAWSLAEADESSRASDALVAALKDSDAKVRATSVWALGNISAEDAVPALSELLASDESDVRMMAAWAIGNIGPRRAPKALLTALADREPEVRTAAAWALYQIEDADAVPALDAALQRETDREVQQAFVRALAAMGETSVDAVRRLLDSKDRAVRATAIRALAGGSASPWPWPMPRPRPFP